MEKQDNFNIFNVGIDDLDTGEDKNTGMSDLYKPKPDQGKDGVYQSLIRFLPNPKNPRKPYIRKYVYWLEDANGNGFYIDSPSTVGDQCPVQDMFFKLRNSDSAVDKKNSESLKRRAVYYSLVQIIKDPQNPDLEGQIKVYKFGYKIKTKIEEELNPKFDEPTQVFDPFDGKNFELVISKKAGYPNYDSSKFQGTRSPMVLNGEKVSNTEEDKKEILEYLNSAPELSNFDYQPWTEEDRNKVMNVLSQYTSPGSSIDNLTSGSNGSNNQSANNSTSTEQQESKQPAQEAVVDSDDDDLDDFIDGLEL